MDTFTHGLLGAAASQAIFAKQLPRSAGLIGFIAGMAPDLDLFLGSGTDPVASILYHRQFTHSLIFIPLGALLVSLLCIWMKPFKGARLAVYGAAFVGYGLHGLLDACTSYGTLLLWPFSYHRIAWDIIAIVDPIFSLALLVGVLWAAIGQAPQACAAGGLLCRNVSGIWYLAVISGDRRTGPACGGPWACHRTSSSDAIAWEFSVLARSLHCGRPYLCRWRTSPVVEQPAGQTWWRHPSRDVR